MLCCLPNKENMGKIIGRKEEEDLKSSGIWICPLLLPPQSLSLFPTHKI